MKNEEDIISGAHFGFGSRLGPAALVFLKKDSSLSFALNKKSFSVYGLPAAELGAVQGFFPLLFKLSSDGLIASTLPRGG